MMNDDANIFKLYQEQAQSDQEPVVRVTIDGSRYYLVNNRFHRTDGPAIEHAGGMKEWLQHGNLHRIDGPAVEHANDGKEWWVDGLEYKDISKWAAAALQHQGIEPTDAKVQQLVQQVMQQDLLD